MNPRLSLYLHIPFCHHRCSYCDFNTYTSLGELRDAYAQALCQEIAQVGAQRDKAKRPIHTIFFGGGTPSIMSANAISQILQTVGSAFNLARDAEISMEANPNTVDEAYLAAVSEAGVNRLSFGMQSAVATELTLLERNHDFSTVVDATMMARKVGLDNFNLDLIYGLPGQTLASWEKSLDAALSLRPSHLSCYCLTIEPGTPMQRWLENGHIQLPDPDLAADMYELTCTVLRGYGYSHYEISNWAHPGRECRHNLAYWRNHSYLGLGAGAHGYAGGYRYQIVKQPRTYIRRMQENKPSHFPLSAAVAEYHQVDRAENMADTVMMQLRLLKEGLHLDKFEHRFGQTLDEAYNGTMTQLQEWGLLWERNGRLLLTEQGRFLSNQVFYRFM
jgi:oxygen-independent coproporphyrinogen-3 oxidase